MSASQKIDFLAVGDIVTDAFIDLQEAEVHCNIDTENCMISMRFGDKIPYKDVVIVKAVGNSPNAAVSAKRLGLIAGIMTHIGDDEEGRDCLEALREQGISTDFVSTDAGMKTNYHYVLRYNAERTILIKHALFPYNFKAEMAEKNAPSWMYFSSIAENSVPFHHDLAKYVMENNVKLAFQPGTFQIKLGYEELKDVYEASELFFCNKEEARRILKVPDADIILLLKSMRELGPKIVIITDGPQGAHVFDGNEIWFMPMYPDPAPPVDRTGAGDSFSSTFTSLLILGKSIPEALALAPINSMSVVQYIGAQQGLLSISSLEKFYADAPEDYQAKRIL